MDAFKKLFLNLSLLVSFAQPLLANDKDWSKTNCPADKEAYVDEAIKLITSGHFSNNESVCLKQEDFKYFNIESNDIGDRAFLKPMIIEDNYKVFILSKTPQKGGKLEVKYKIVNALDVESDSFSLYYTFDENGKSKSGCVDFFDAPSKLFLKKSCVKTKPISQAL
jgi:hypothetical protein